MSARESGPTFVWAYDTTTGEKARVPQEWIGNPLMPNLSLTPTARAKARGTDDTPKEG